VAAAEEKMEEATRRTEATVHAQAYPQEIHKIDPRTRVRQQACPDLVPLIEAGNMEDAGKAARRYLKLLLASDSAIDTVLLGCTHYALIEDRIRSAAPPGIHVVSQGAIMAGKLENYLWRHPEITRRLGTSGHATFLTTALSNRIQQLAVQFYRSPLRMETLELPAPAGHGEGI
jgi:glutamate racemase